MLSICNYNFGEVYFLESTQLVSIVPNVNKYGIIPKAMGILKGSTIVIKCMSTSPVEWSFKNQKIKKAKYIDNTIFIPNAEYPRHHTRYICKGTNQNWKAFESIVDVLVGSELILIQ